MDESSERSDTEGERERELKYSGRKGSDKFQRRVSSKSSRFHFRRPEIQRDFRLEDVYGGLIMGERV